MQFYLRFYAEELLSSESADSYLYHFKIESFILNEVVVQCIKFIQQPYSEPNN